MQKNKPEIDVVDKILQACYEYNPDALFVLSLMHQYEERGSLSKKQLQGLLQKASHVKDMPANLLATLEARIAKMPNRFKSEAPVASPELSKNNMAETLAKNILEKYPQHKRVIFLQQKMLSNQTILPAEVAELERFAKLLLKQ